MTKWYFYAAGSALVIAGLVFFVHTIKRNGELEAAVESLAQTVVLQDKAAKAREETASELRRRNNAILARLRDLQNQAIPLTPSQDACERTSLPSDYVDRVLSIAGQN